MRTIYSKIFFVMLMVALSGCVHNGVQTENSYNVTKMSSAELLAREQLYQQYHEWQGTPYQYGGNSKFGIDCSAFVQVVYLSAQQTSLPRTTAAQSQVGKPVSYARLQVGDLIFFKPKSSARHVGIYLGSQQFMHASTSKGVIISRLDNPYWQAIFWQARRLVL